MNRPEQLPRTPGNLVSGMIAGTTCGCGGWICADVDVRVRPSRQHGHGLLSAQDPHRNQADVYLGYVSLGIRLGAGAKRVPAPTVHAQRRGTAGLTAGGACPWRPAPL